MEPLLEAIVSMLLSPPPIPGVVFLLLWISLESFFFFLPLYIGMFIFPLLPHPNRELFEDTLERNC